MGKKKITGQSKLLQRQETGSNLKEPVNLMTPKKQKPVLKNYRLNSLDLINLNKIVTDVNKLHPYQVISETKIIKALILIGSKISPGKILKAVKEVL